MKNIIIYVYREANTPFYLYDVFDTSRQELIAGNGATDNNELARNIMPANLRLDLSLSKETTFEYRGYCPLILGQNDDLDIETKEELEDLLEITIDYLH